MPLLSPAYSPIGEYLHHEGSHLDVRPTLSGFGTTVTPGNNTFGTAVQVGSVLAQDCWLLHIAVTAIASNGTAKDSLTQIGFDFAGGTTFPASPDRFNSITLLTSCAASRGVVYLFPLYLPAGTSILARGSVNNATVGTQSVAWQAWGRPKYPEATRRGYWVESLGITEATSNGTSVTSGTTAEGSWTNIGSTLAADAWWWDLGFGVNDSTMNNLAYHADLGYNSGSPIIAEDQLFITSNGEDVNKGRPLLAVMQVPSGTQMQGRLQCSGNADGDLSMAIYALGG